MLHGYGVAGLDCRNAPRKTFFFQGSAARPWWCVAAHTKAAYLYKGYEKFLVKEVHEALHKVLGAASFAACWLTQCNASVCVIDCEMR